MCKRLSVLWRGVAVTLVLAGIVLAAGCGKTTGEVELGAGNNGSQVTVSKGQTLAVTLDSNPSTGYRWEMVPADDGILEQVGEAEFNENPRSKGMVGAGGTETLRFEAKKTGQTSLELVYRRPWEQGEKPAETFAVQVTVE